MTNPATTALVTSIDPLLPAVHVDLPLASQLPVPVRPYDQTYQRAVNAVVVSKKEVDAYRKKAGPNATGSGIANWISAHCEPIGLTSVIGGGLSGFVGFLACIGPGAMSHTATLVAQGGFAAFAVAVPTAILAVTSGVIATEVRAKANARRLTTKQAASFLKRIRSLDNDERAALKPALTDMLKSLKGTLSSKAYGEAQALLESTTTPASPVEQRAAIVAQFVSTSLKGESCGTGNLCTAIDQAEPDERRAIAAVLEKALFVNEQQRAPFPDPDGLYLIITKAAEGLSPLEKKS